MAPKKVRVITRSQIEAMKTEAVRAALEQQRHELANREQTERLQTTQAYLQELEMEREQEKRRRLASEQTEDSLRMKIRDLEQALKMRSGLLDEQTRQAFEEGRAEAAHEIAALKAQLAQQPTPPPRAPAPAPDPDALIKQMEKTIAEQVAAKFDEARRLREATVVREKDVVLDSLFKEDGLDTNQARMTLRTSTGKGVSAALNKLKTFHEGRDKLETDHSGDPTP